MTRTLPGPGTVEALLGLRRAGFLDYVGEQWRAHGDVFELKLGPRRLLFAMHPDAVRHVNVSQRQGYDKLRSYDTVRRYLTPQGLVVSTGDLWRRQRKLLAPFYTPKAIKAYAGLMIADAVALGDRWDELAASGQVVDMGDEMMLVTASIILKAMFSTTSDEAIVALKDRIELMIAYVTDQAALPHPDWLPSARNRRYREAAAQVDEFMTDIIAQRRALPEAEWPDDMLTRLMQARDPNTGEPMSESLLRDESITTFFAGHETTARTLTATWYELAANPEVAARLHAELDEVLGDREITVGDLFALPYTLQVVKEALRLHPPAPFYARDAAAADEFEGFGIPAGSAVMLSPYYTHRHPDFWDDPDRFDPDRWTPEAEAARHPNAYHPFATGPRVCIGNHFSLLESHLLLAVLARRFAPELVDGHQPKWMMGGVLTSANGMPMTITPRRGLQV